MIQKALQYLVDLGVKNDPIVTVADKQYSAIPLHPVKEVSPDPLEFNFLDSLSQLRIDLHNHTHLSNDY